MSRPCEKIGRSRHHRRANGYSAPHDIYIHSCIRVCYSFVRASAFNRMTLSLENSFSAVRRQDLSSGPTCVFLWLWLSRFSLYLGISSSQKIYFQTVCVCFGHSVSSKPFCFCHKVLWSRDFLLFLCLSVVLFFIFVITSCYELY